MRKKFTYRKQIAFLVGVSASLLFVSGCGSQSEDAYNKALQNGLDVLAAEDYTKAEVYFEMALEEKPEDEKAKILLLQTTNFEDALQLFDEEKHTESMIMCEGIIAAKGGSSALITKAEKLIEDIQQLENKETTHTGTEKTEYVYDDFKGMYAGFESTPYESPIEYVSVFTDTHYIDAVKDWSTYSVSDILNKRITNNMLDFDFFTPESAGEGASEGKLQIELIEKNGQKSLYYIISETTVYPISEQDLLNEGWSLPPTLEDSQHMIEEENHSEDSISAKDIIDTYNNLPLPLKVLLAATTVDERAMSPELLGYNLYYKFDNDTLFVNIHSGAGVGHPWYAIKYDRETITPFQGVVYQGIDGYEESIVTPTPVSKIDLYNRYIESKESYDAAVANIVETPEMTGAEFEKMRSEVY